MSPTAKPFPDRRAAGRALASRLAGHADPRLVVLGLPRGGVVVAAEVARALHATLDIVVVRKIGVPWQPELAMGALAAVGGEVETVRNAEVMHQLQIDEDTFARAREREVAELRRREAAYRRGRPAAPLTGRPVVVVDDGLATGATMRAAVAAIGRQEPGRLTLAVPVGSPGACDRFTAEVDEVVCLRAPSSFSAVGAGYRDFRATTDEEVLEALSRAAGGA